MAWVLPEDASDRCASLLLTAVDEGVLVPPLWCIEVGNILMVRRRRGVMSEAEWRQAVSRLAEVTLVFDAGTPAFPPGAAVEIGMKHRLTLYDATYLELAQRRDLPLATLDRALRAATQAEGVRCLP